MKRLLTALFALSTVSMVSATELPEDGILLTINGGEVVAVLELLEYELSTMTIDISTAEPLSCQKDGDNLFNSRFQKEVTLNVMGSNPPESVTVESLIYELGAGIVNIVTREAIVCT